MFCVFDRNRRPWRPLHQCDASTCLMAASSGFKWSPGCAPWGDPPHILPPHPHDNQNRRQFAWCSMGDPPHVLPPHPHDNRNRRQFAWFFFRVDFIVGHNLKLKTKLWLISTKIELDCCSYSCYEPICIVWMPTIDDGCRFGHHIWRWTSDSLKTLAEVQLN